MNILTIVLLGTSTPILLIYLIEKYKQFRFPPCLAYYVDEEKSTELDYSRILHRENGPAVIIKRHREEYWINGIQHRWDGPAVINYGLGGVNQYFINGMQISSKMFNVVRYADEEDLAQFLVSTRLEIRQLAEYRMKEIYDN